MSLARQRMFFALWPDEAVRAQLAAAIPEPTDAGRVIATENLHVTLAFLGDVDVARITDLQRIASAVQGQPFELLLTHIEVWNRSLVCLVPGHLPERLASLVRTLVDGLSKNDFPVDARDYRAHVTVIRERKRGLGRRKAMMHGARDGDALGSQIAWTVDSFALVCSQPGPTGSRYEVVASWPLSGARETV